MIGEGNSWFSNVTDREIQDFVVEKFGLYAPTVVPMRTSKGQEVYKIDGIKYHDKYNYERVVFFLNSVLLKL